MSFLEILMLKAQAKNALPDHLALYDIGGDVSWVVYGDSGGPSCVTIAYVVDHRKHLLCGFEFSALELDTHPDVVEARIAKAATMLHAFDRRDLGRAPKELTCQSI